THRAVHVRGIERRHLAGVDAALTLLDFRIHCLPLSSCPPGAAGDPAGGRSPPVHVGGAKKPSARLLAPVRSGCHGAANTAVTTIPLQTKTSLNLTSGFGARPPLPLSSFSRPHLPTLRSKCHIMYDTFNSPMLSSPAPPLAIL